MNYNFILSVYDPILDREGRLFFTFKLRTFPRLGSFPLAIKEAPFTTERSITHHESSKYPHNNARNPMLRPSHSFLELAKRIVAFHSYHVSLLVLQTDASPAQSQLLCSVTLSIGLKIIDIPSVDIARYVDDDAHVFTRLSMIVRESLPHIESCIGRIARTTVLVVDMSATVALDIPAENILNKCIFFLPNPTLLAFMMYLPSLDKEVDGEFTHLPGPVQVPGWLSPY